MREVTVTLTEEERDSTENALDYFARVCSNTEQPIFLAVLAKLRGEAPAPAPACGRCAFWRDHQSIAAIGPGHCERHAPMHHRETGTTWYPGTAADDSCGEFSERGGADA